MTFDEFTEAAGQREIRQHGSAYPFEPWYYALGLTGDAGEVGDKVKRIYRDAGGDVSRLPPRDRDILLHELGDVLWYVNALAVKLGGSLDDVAHRHRDRLDDLERRGALPASKGATPGAPGPGPAAPPAPRETGPPTAD
jgi:NTP pyrophosphatase (non-canonical NTP hydrolase)